MNCEKYRILIEKYLDGVMGDVELAEFKEHAEKCAVCRKEFQRCKNLQNVVQEILSGATSPEQARYTILSKVTTGPQLAASSTNKSALGTIIRSRITKLAAAAVIIIGVFLGLNHIGGPDMISVAWADMPNAIKAMPWIHGTVFNQLKNKPEGEFWLCFPAQIVMLDGCYEGGDIGVFNNIDRVQYVYDANSRTIRVSYIEHAEQVFEHALYPWRQVENAIERFASAEDRVVEETGEYEGKNVELYTLEDAKDTYVSHIFTCIIDGESGLPIAIEQKAVVKKIQQANQHWLTRLDYPEEGPRDIYALGAPESAKMVDDLPGPGVVEVLDTYYEYRDSAPSRYVAIFTESTGGNRERLTFVEYRDGVHRRWELYDITGKPGGRYFAWDEFMSVLKNESVESVLRWWENAKYKRINYVRIYDEKHQYAFGAVDLEGKRHSPRVSILTHYRSTSELTKLGWPFLLYSGSRIIEDNYSRESNLICVDNNNYRYYLDPERDYICQRVEGAATREVIQFGQTSSGRWYPKAVTRWHPTQPKRHPVTRVYLQDDPAFEEGIFDPERVYDRSWE